MHRRAFLTYLAAGTLGTTLAGCATASEGTAGVPVPSPVPRTAPTRSASVQVPRVLSEVRRTSVPISPGVLSELPAAVGPGLALTIDDGCRSDVVRAYIDFARHTGARFTFFVTASYPSWTENRAALAPLVESGQIQLGNHTWSHPDLTQLGSAGVAEELTRTKHFLRNTYGVDGTPFYRPPYGFRNAAVDAVAADLGYPVSTLWNGSLSDSQVITPRYLLHCARQYFTAHAIVIGHANHPAVTHLYPQLAEIIRERRLTTMTFNDAVALRHRG